MMSWPVDLENPAPGFKFCKVVAMEEVISPDVEWEDAFNEPPPGKKPNEEDDGEVGPYTVDYEGCGDCGAICQKCQKGQARCKMLDRVRRIEMRGGCGAFDKNGVAWGDTPRRQFEMVKYLTGSEHTTYLGRAHNWFVFWNYKGIYMLKLDYGADDLVRILVVFCPWCNMFFSKTGTRVDTKLINSRLYTATSAEWARMFFDILRNPRASLVADQSLDRPIGGDILFAVAALQIPLISCGHVNLKAAAVVTKSIIDANVNHLSPNCTQLIRTAGETTEDQLRIGESSRHDININRERKTTVTHDYFKNLSVLRNCLKGRNVDEALDLILTGLCEDRKQAKRGKSDVTDKKKVIDSFIKLAIEAELFVDPALVSRLRQRYEGEFRQNRGNPNARGSDLGTIEASESFIDPYAKEAIKNKRVSNEFIAQAAGSSETKNRAATRQDGTLQGFPEDGTRVFYTDIETGSRESFVFRHKLVLRGKLFYSLNDTFTKKAKGSGTGGNKKVERYDKKLRLQYRRGMLDLNSKKVGVGRANDSNWVVARVVYGPTKGDTR